MSLPGDSHPENPLELRNGDSDKSDIESIDSGKVDLENDNSHPDKLPNGRLEIGDLQTDELPNSGLSNTGSQNHSSNDELHTITTQKNFLQPPAPEGDRSVGWEEGERTGADAEGEEEERLRSYTIQHRWARPSRVFDTELSRQLHYLEAAIYLQEGERNEQFEFHPKTERDLFYYRISHNNIYYSLELFMAIGFIMTGFYYAPYVLNKFTDAIIIIADILIFTFFMLQNAILKTRFIPLNKLVKYPGKMTNLVLEFVILLSILMTIIDVVLEADYFIVPVTLSRALRVKFLTDCYYASGMRRVMRQILQTIPAVLEMIGLLFFVLTVFSILGFVLFYCLDPSGFRDLGTSFMSLFILMTTANFPDVMMKVYAVHRGYALFFVVFLCTEFYFILNLFLAVVYDTFSDHEKSKFKKLICHRRESSRLAFDTVTEGDSMDFETFRGVMKYYWPNKSSRDVFLLFLLLDKDRSYRLGYNEFYRVFKFVELQWIPLDGLLYWFDKCEMHSQVREVFRFLNKLATHEYFRYFFQLVIFTNFLSILLLCAFVDHSARHQNLEYGWTKDFFADLATIDTVFWVMYVIEVLVKLPGLGCVYFQSGWNTYDFILTLIGTVGEFLDWTDNSESEQLKNFGIALILLRFVRLLRLINLKESLANVFVTSQVLRGKLLSIAGVVVVVYYVYAQVAMSAFGQYDAAYMYNCCPNTSYGNAYVTGGYQLNIFNTLSDCYVTLFELTVINNWFITMWAYVHVTGSNWTVLFFMSFFLLMLMITTVLISFILETFLFRMKDLRQTKKNMEKKSNADTKSPENEVKNESSEENPDIPEDPLRLLMQRVVSVSFKEFNQFLPDHWEESLQTRNLYPSPTSSAKFLGFRRRTKDDYNFILYDFDDNELPPIS